MTERPPEISRKETHKAEAAWGKSGLFVLAICHLTPAACRNNIPAGCSLLPASDGTEAVWGTGNDHP